MKRAVAILLFVSSTVLLWVASSPTTLDAFVLPSRVTASQKSASEVSVTAQRPTEKASQAKHGTLTPPVALLLQGIVFLACGILWPKKSEDSSAEQSRAPAPRSSACGVETAGAD